ncbi:hypothetical protein ALDI51_17180 [Alicycliphilus denitrificans]|uniref:hypothetical protein n=1 Tax=Alicycliphilus denitrificans TaxID=179636 RepID=UPI001915FE38|nr:hypothetical protein [Alicycliphilus denitrificans]BCN38399.1 hypothetical protein ALDI51_17180 [Alicycliphilus denitrificans]
MLESILLVVYAAASIALAVWARRASRLRLDWSHPNMRKPVFDRTVQSTGGAGALGAADAVSSAALTSASPSVVMVFIIVVAGLFGGFIGAGVVPALVGGIGQPNWMGMMALVVATLAWAWIGGCLALPVLALAFGLAPVIIGIGLFGFAAMALWQTFSSGHPNPFSGNGTWQAAFGARVDYNLCAAGTSLITLGNSAEIARKCKQQVVGPHPVEGRFAGVYSCGKGQRIAAIVDVRPFGPYRNGSKDAEFQFSDQPEIMFPNGAFAGFVRPSDTTGEFRSDGLAWTQKPGPGWGKPDQLAITTQPAGGISVRLLNTPCTTLQAQRCEPAQAGRVPTCEKELARQGVKLYVPRTLNELSKVIADQEARQARTR